MKYGEYLALEPRERARVTVGYMKLNGLPIDAPRHLTRAEVKLVDLKAIDDMEAHEKERWVAAQMLTG